MSEANDGGAGVSNVSRVPESSKNYGPTEGSQASPHLRAIWTELMGLKRLVENEHDRKLRRIETDLLRASL